MRAILVVFACVAEVGCVRHEGGQPEGGQQSVVVTDTFPQAVAPKLDILFVIGNALAMLPEQDSLIQYFPDFVQPLQDINADLHIGIVTSDLGAGPFTTVPGCHVGGDQGMLQNTPRLTGPGQQCTTASLINATDRFLVYSPNADGTVTTNFSGNIAEAFACYAAVGIGCGVHSPLGSPMVALQGCNTDAGCTQPLNAGFLRDDAFLALVILMDQDDASSAPDATLWDPSENSSTSTLGCLTSYRGVEFGILCGCTDGNDPSTCQPLGRQPGPRQSCVPGSFDPDPQHQEIPVEDFAAFFKGLKPQDPRMVYVSAITGPPAHVAVGVDQNGCPVMEPSCVGGLAPDAWVAMPGVRLAEFIDLFDVDRSSFQSLCQQDLKAPMEQFGAALATMLGQQCLSAPPQDAGGGAGPLQPDCLVEEVSVTDAGNGSGTTTSVTIPPCDPVVCEPSTAPNGDCTCATHSLPAGAGGCWYLWSDTTACPMVSAAAPEQQARVGSGYQIRVDRGIDPSCRNPPAPAGTTTVVRCSACIASPKDSYYDCSPGCSQYWPNCCPTPSAGCFQ